MAKPIETGDTISVHYTGKFLSGDEFDSSSGNPPLIFTVGAGQLIPGFDNGVIGMAPGEKKTITIAPEDAYGAYREDLVVDCPREKIPPDMELEVGMGLRMMGNTGQPVPVVVAAILDDVVKLDVNHPMAGKTLVFDIEIVETGLEPQCHSCSDDCTDCH
jgi:peptidylprolyl isomerase